MLKLNWLQQKRHRKIVMRLLLPALVVVSSGLTVSELQAQAVTCSGTKVLDQTTNSCVDCISVDDTGCAASSQCCGTLSCDLLAPNGQCITAGQIAEIAVFAFVFSVAAGRVLAYVVFSRSGSGSLQTSEAQQIVVNSDDTAMDVAVSNGLSLTQAAVALRAAQDTAVQHAIATGTSVDVAYSGNGIRIGTPSAATSKAIATYTQARAAGGAPSGPITPGQNAAAADLTKSNGLLAQKALENWPTDSSGAPVIFDTMTEAIAADQTGDLARLALAIASQINSGDADADAKTVQKKFIDAVMGTKAGEVYGVELFADDAGGIPAGLAYAAAAQATQGQIITAIGQSPYAQELRADSDAEDYSDAELLEFQQAYTHANLSQAAVNLSYALSGVENRTQFVQFDRSYVDASRGFQELYGETGIEMTPDGYYPSGGVSMSGL